MIYWVGHWPISRFLVILILLLCHISYPQQLIWYCCWIFYSISFFLFLILQLEKMTKDAALGFWNVKNSGKKSCKSFKHAEKHTFCARSKAYANISAYYSWTLWSWGTKFQKKVELYVMHTLIALKRSYDAHFWLQS